MNEYQEQLLQWQKAISNAWQRSQNGESLAEAQRDVLAIEAKLLPTMADHYVGRNLSSDWIGRPCEVLAIQPFTDQDGGTHYDYLVQLPNQAEWFSRERLNDWNLTATK